MKSPRPFRILLAPLLVAVAAGAFAQAPAPASSKLIPTFLVYYGGGPSLVAADAARLAKFDLIDIDRFRYADISPSTWAAVKTLNPALQFYLYEMGAEAQNYMDAAAVVSLNGLGRYDVSRGHSMGSLNGNHPELFLLDAAGNRIYNTGFSNPGANQFWHLMDFGSPAYQAYWVEAVRADIANQPWVADGVHADNCLTLAAAGGYSATSVKYPTDAAWTSAMTGFAAAITAGLHGYGQKLWCNRGSTNIATGAAAWRALDSAATPPDVVGEEGAFAVAWGPWSTQFYAEADWKRQVDTIGAISNSKVAVFSHTALGEGGSGTDNWGRPVTYWQTLWYALGSFLISKNGTLNNAYFNFTGNGGAYNRIWWYPEYELIDLGKPVGTYAVSVVGGVNLYWREFEKGYVYVNPTATDVASVAVPQAVKLLTHDNLTLPLSGLPDVSSISLGAHAAAIVAKSSLLTVDTIPPSVPAGLAAAAASSTQINLTWTASTDNVGVSGYRVYRAGTLVATTAAPSYADAGLAASTSYGYSVAAFDAAGNASAPSAVVTARTQNKPDNKAPSVPGGLSAAPASSRLINLKWNASTDDVGVSGYKVFRAGVQIATVAVPAYGDGAVSPATSYSYTVAAFDAAGNTSAQSAAVSATTPAARARSDFDGDGKSDVLWRNKLTGENAIFFMNGATVLSTTSIRPITDLDWSVAGVGDFDGDGKADILWRNAATGENGIYFMSGGTVIGVVYINTVADLNWSVAGVGDFDGDGKSDVLWRNQLTGENAIFFMNGATVLNTIFIRPITDLNWSVAGVGDFDGDGKADVLWRNSATGEDGIYFMSGGTVLSVVYINTVADLNWGVAGVGDFDGDGKSDVLWRNAVTGENTVFFMNGATVLSTTSIRPITDLNWSAAEVGDFDGDGKADILWRNAATGEDGIYFMNGGAVTAVTYIASLPVAGWSIALR